jgi:[ribosomal protein S18]-alanine N-acetyltransferase
MYGVLMRRSSGKGPLPVRARTSPTESPVSVMPCRSTDSSTVEVLLQCCPEAAAWTAVSVKEIIEQYPKLFLIAMRGREVTGFISGRRIREDGEILNLAVQPRTRRGGVAKALLEALLEEFRREEVLQVFLEVRESNEAAIAFYRKSGFHQAGRRPRYYRNPEEDALVLTLNLGRADGSCSARSPGQSKP